MAWLPVGWELRPTQLILATVVPLDFVPFTDTMSQTKIPGKNVAGAVILASIVVEVPFFSGFAKLSWYSTTFSISMVRIYAGAVCARTVGPSAAVKARLARTTFRKAILCPFLSF